MGAPGSFVLQGSRQAYFLAGYDRLQGILFSDLWTIDLQPLFDELNENPDENNSNQLTPEAQNSDELNENPDENISNQLTPEAQNSESSSALPFGNVRDSVSLIVAISSLALVLCM